MNPPSAFTGSPGYGSQHPPATPAFLVTDEPRAAYGSKPATGQLTIHADGTVCIDARSARLLPAGDNTIDLRQPVKDGATWHLDCRPSGLCQRRPDGASGGIRFRALARVRLLLGCLPGPVRFAFEADGAGLFRLSPQHGDKL